MKKLLLIPVLSLALLGFAAYGTTKAYAEDNAEAYPPIVQKLVERFGLNADKVEQVFDEERDERHQEMQAHFEERLTQMVSEGKITETQKQAIVARHEEMRNNRPDPEEFRNMSVEERHQAMEQKRTELETWAQEQGIDTSLFPFVLGGHGGFGGPHFNMMK